MSVGAGTHDTATEAGSGPAKAGLVLLSLVLAASVANLNLAVANVALPTIGKTFDTSQTMLNLVAVGYSLGLAASVLYLGAVGDRYGRKLMLLVGAAMSIPLSVLAAYAPSPEVLVAARILGGVTGGLCYPTTLALIAALWTGPARTKAIALWSASGAAMAALAPLLSGILLHHFWWGSVFLITTPVAAIAFVLAWFRVPAHMNETTQPVDNLAELETVQQVHRVGIWQGSVDYAIAARTADQRRCWLGGTLRTPDLADFIAGAVGAYYGVPVKTFREKMRQSRLAAEVTRKNRGSREAE